MKQVQIFQNTNDIQVNKWLKNHADKNIIDIKYCVGNNNNIVVMIIYEE